MENNPEVQKKKLNKIDRPRNRALLIILGILLIISLLLTVTGYDLFRVLFNSVQVKELLFNEVKGSNLIPAVFEYFSVDRAKERVEKGEALSGVSEPDIPLLMSFMQLEDWREIKSLLLEDEFITHLVSVSVDGTFAWIDSADINPQIVWRMNPLKESLVGKAGENSVMVGYEALPECTQEQIDDFTSRMAASPPGVEVLYNLCRFPLPWKPDQIDDYTHALVDVNNNIPAEFSFSKMLEQNQKTADVLMPFVKTLLKCIRWMGKWGWIVTLVLIALIILLGSKPITRLGKTLGVPLTIAGCILLLQYFLGQGPIQKWLINLLLTQTSDVVRQEMVASFTHLSGQIFKPLLLQTTIILAIGILMIVLSAVFKNKLKKEIH